MNSWMYCRSPWQRNEPLPASLFSIPELMRSRIETGQATKPSFIKWVNKYLLRDEWRPCTAEDLYASRCAILHTFSAESDRSRAGKVVPIWYCSSSAQPETLPLAMKYFG